MASFLNICLQVPNLGTIAFMLIFVFGIPLALYYFDSLSLLQIYAPFVVMLASTVTQSGKPHIFAQLYQTDPENPTAFMTANIINLFALISILWYSVGIAIYYNSVELGVSVGTVMFIVTFPVSRQMIPFMIQEGDKMLKTRTTFIYPYNWHKYMMGAIVMGGLLSIQYILVSVMVENIK